MGRGAARPRTVLYVAITAGLLMAAYAVYQSHRLVALGTDRPAETALFATDELAGGQSTTTSLAITNQGLLSADYSLSVARPGGTPAPPAFRLRVRRLSDARVLYEGPLPAASGKLGELEPGQAERLELTVSLPRERSTQKLALDVLFIWKAQVSLSGTWLLPMFEIFLVLAVLTIVGRWFLESRGPGAVPMRSGAGRR